MGSRVLLVEDEPNALRRCVQIIEQHPALTLGDAVTSLAAARSLLERGLSAYDLLLTDLQLGDGHGTTLIRAWRAQTESPAMVITVFGDVESVLSAVEAGADGYLLKSGSDQEMTEAIDTVLSGGAPISASVAGHLLRRLRRSEADENPAQTEAETTYLTDRETDVLTDLACGMSYKDVARNRSISPHTVAGHVKVIYKKLAVNSRGEAVFKAISTGLIDLEKP